MNYPRTKGIPVIAASTMMKENKMKESDQADKAMQELKKVCETWKPDDNMKKSCDTCKHSVGMEDRDSLCGKPCKAFLLWEEKENNMATESTTKIDLMNPDMKIWAKFTEDEQNYFKTIFAIKASIVEYYSYTGEWCRFYGHINWGCNVVYRIILTKEEPKKPEPKLVKYEVRELDTYSSKPKMLVFRYKNGEEYYIHDALNMKDFVYYEYADGSTTVSPRVKFMVQRTYYPKYVCFWEEV